MEWIKQGKHRRIALQFPDSMLPYSEKVSKIIESAVQPENPSEGVSKTFVLADTSYRRCVTIPVEHLHIDRFSCCVDEVAAAHANCTALIHYGEACHSALTDNIDVK